MPRLTIDILNNPAAIRKPGSLEFQRFNSPEESIREQEALLNRYHRNGRRSVSSIVERYAPRKRNGGDNTDEQVDNYIHYVATRLGVNPRDTIAPTLIPRLASTMREFETGRGKKKVGPAPKNTASNDLVGAAAAAFGTPLKQYTVAAPGANEGSVTTPPPAIDMGNVQSRTSDAVTTSDRYAQFLKDAVTPITQNVQQQIQRQQAIVGIKRNIVNDFAVREAHLEEQIRPLMAEREQLAAQLLRVDQMNPLEQRFKAIFNPRQYDPRIIRGRLERVESAMGIYESNYEELNKLRSGVAAASVDAEQTDQQLLELGRQSTMSQLQLFGQVAGTVKQNAADQLLPLATHVEVLKLQESTKLSFLGKLSLERTVQLYDQARSSEDGTVTVDGITLTVGELQDAARVAQQQNLTFRSMINSFRTSDLATTDALEANYIDHMTPEQINEAMKNGGKITGANGETYQLNSSRLAAAAQTAETVRTARVNDIISQTLEGQSGQFLENLGNQMTATQRRAIDMFGSVPGELRSTLVGVMTEYHAWKKGLDTARQQGETVARQYIAQTQPQWTKWQGIFDTAVTNIANKWGGGKKELGVVAENYLRGNPLSGDVAIRALITVARSGMPSGSRLQGPAAQAFAVAQSTVQEWDNPQAGDSLDALLKGGNKRESDLQRLVQQRVSAVYADSIADAVIKDLPQLARSVRDPNNPGRLHPFSRVSREDFLMAVRHGDASAYQIVGQKMGIDPNQARRIFSSGIDSPEWQALARNKGWNKGNFADFYSALQALQMSETLSALDASHSSAPGFSPAQAYIDFLQRPEVQNKVNQTVQSYGQSNFGSYLLSSSAGGGFQDSWDNYTQSLGAVYQQQHSKELRNRIQQQRTLNGDPWVRVNAVNRAAGLNPQESQVLLQAIKPLVSAADVAPRLGAHDVPLSSTRGFDAITNIIRNHKFDNPQIERLRRRVDQQWEAMDALVGTVFESVND